MQRESLHRTGMMISTEVMPVISKLESTVMSLEAVSQNAGGILETISGRLQQSTQDMKQCLDGFNGANLRGVGVSMALPWLESRTVWGDTPPAGVKPSSEAPVRLGVALDTV